jgi:ABC-2 type transport system ATP-binding protein
MTTPSPKGDVVLSTRGLCKRYGRIEALKDVTLEVRRGEIFGLLGQNGAGKTTMVKVFLSIAAPTFGEAWLLGQPVGVAAVRKNVGYLPEDHRFPEYHTGASLLDYYGALLELPRAERRRRGQEMLDLVGLKKRMNTKIRTYSKGMKQRLGIAQAVFHDPEVLFLDEPTDGVDPVGRREIRDLLQQLKARGKTIFLNSHLLGEVELICDRVAILQAGELIRQGSMAELTQQHGMFVIGLADGQTMPRDELAASGYDVKRDGALWEIGLKDGQHIDPVVDLLRSRGLSIRHLVEKRQTLEDIFIATVEAAEPGVDRPLNRKPQAITRRGRKP